MSDLIHRLAQTKIRGDSFDVALLKRPGFYRSPLKIAEILTDNPARENGKSACPIEHLSLGNGSFTRRLDPVDLTH